MFFLFRFVFQVGTCGKDVPEPRVEHGWNTKSIFTRDNGGVRPRSKLDPERGARARKTKNARRFFAASSRTLTSARGGILFRISYGKWEILSPGGCDLISIPVAVRVRGHFPHE